MKDDKDKVTTVNPRAVEDYGAHMCRWTVNGNDDGKYAFSWIDETSKEEVLDAKRKQYTVVTHEDGFDVPFADPGTGKDPVRQGNRILMRCLSEVAVARQRRMAAQMSGRRQKTGKEAERSGKMSAQFSQERRAPKPSFASA